MIEYSLFLGFAADPIFLAQLKKQDPAHVNAFLDAKGPYLKKVNFQDMVFIGKHLKTPVEVEFIEATEKNVISLLKKIVPDFPYQETPLYLFPIASHE